MKCRFLTIGQLQRLSMCGIRRYDAFMMGASFAALVRLHEARRRAMRAAAPPLPSAPELSPEKLRTLSASHILAAVERSAQPSVAGHAPSLEAVQVCVS